MSISLDLQRNDSSERSLAELGHIPFLNSIRGVRWFFVALLAVTTLTVYAPTINHDFVDWDDSKILAAIWKPGWERAREIVLDFDLSFSKEVYYSPLHLLSLMLDQALAFTPEKPQAWVSKFMNVVLHVANSLLVLKFLLMTGLGRRSAFLAALIFAVHPIQVGTVAWITERKNLLVTFFYLASLIGFLTYLRIGRNRWIPILILLFIAGLLSKPLAVTLPVAFGMLLLILAPESTPRADTRSLAFLFAVLFSAAIAWGVFVLSTERLHSWILPSWPYRPLLAAAAVWFSVGKILFPMGLVPLYPRWDIEANVGWMILPLVALLLVAALIVYFRNRLDRWILWGLLLFLLNLAPVVGLVPFGYMSHSFVADHFVYLPMVGVVLILGHLIERVCSRIGEDSRYAHVLFVCLYAWAAILGFLTVRQTAVWKNSASMWNATVKVNKTSFAAYNNYGMIRLNNGDYHEALQLFSKAKSLAPKLDKPHHNIGETYLKMGQREQAKRMFAKSVALNPGNVGSNMRLAMMLRAEGKPQESVRLLKEAIRANPASAELYSELGVTQYGLGNLEDALTRFQKAIDINPLMSTPRVHKGIILLSRGDVEGALEEARQAIRFSRDARAHNLLGVTYVRQGHLKQALKEFLTAYEIRPNLPTVRDNVANAYMDLRRFAEARNFCDAARRMGYRCDNNTLKRIQESKGRETVSE